MSVPLDRHNQAVAAMVDQFSRACGLPEPQRLALVHAARSHDIGKTDPRFQTWLHQGNSLAAREWHLTSLPSREGCPIADYNANWLAGRADTPVGQGTNYSLCGSCRNG